MEAVGTQCLWVCCYYNRVLMPVTNTLWAWAQTPEGTEVEGGPEAPQTEGMSTETRPPKGEIG